MPTYTIKYFTKNPPCTEVEIQALEQKIGVSLIPAHRDLLLQANGLLVFYNSFLPKEGYGGEVCEVASKEMVAKCWNNLSEQKSVDFDFQSLCLIPFATSLGPDTYFLSYAPETYGEVWQMDSAGYVYFQAKDFATFWAEIRWAKNDERQSLPAEAYPYNLPAQSLIV